MPLYEYECESCAHRFERIQKFSDRPVDVCPNCGKQTVKKLLSSPAIQFKGSGWYITDYAKKSTTDAGKGGASSSGGDSTPSTTKATDTSAGSSEKKSS
jgi:putative FmdB family regulatory protein